MAKKAKTPTDGGEEAGDGVSRRSFLVLAGSMALGRFSLPEADPGERNNGPTRRLIQAPTRWGPGDANLMWSEVGSSGEASVRVWMPETEEEVAQAEAFFSAAAKVDWDQVILADVPMPGDPSSPRRFEFVEGDSAKFWEVTSLDSGFRVRFGKVGTAGQTQEKAFPNPEAAAKAMDKLVAEKVRKGYVEVSAPPEPARPKKARSASDGPPDWTTEDAWREVFDDLEISIRHGKKPAIPSPEELDAFEEAMNFRLPASYRAFIRVFGPGTFSGATVQIFAPGTLYHEMGAEQAEFASFAENIDFLSDRGNQAEPITHMIVFAEDIVPRFFGWDFQDVRDPSTREYAIREYDFEYDTCPIVANSFPEFINEFVRVQRAGESGDAEEARQYFREDGKQATKPRAKAASKPVAKEKAKAKRSPIEERALMMAVVAAPDDPTSWLTYADWLDGYKDKLGPLIRLRLAGPDAADPVLEATLIAGLGKSWDKRLVAVGLLPAILARLGDRSQVYADDEGRIYHMRLAGDLINARVLASFADAPALKELEFEDHQFTRDEIEALSRISAVRTLHLHSSAGADDFAIIARMANLEELCMGGNPIPGEGLRHLAALPRLSTLHLEVAGDGEDLAHLEALPALTDLWFIPSGREEGGWLASVGRLCRLETLGLARNSIRDDDLAHLAGLTNLRRLDLTYTAITDAGLAHLSGLANLRHLDLSDTETTGAGLVHLESLIHLETLGLSDNPVGDVGLASIGKLTNLRELEIRDDFNQPTITGSGFAQFRHLTRLVELRFEYANPTDDDLAHLSGLVDLESLTFRTSTRIAGPGLAHLASLTRLKRLDMHSAELTDAAVGPLSALTWLEYLSIGNCPISAEGRQRLQDALPDTQF